MINCFRPFGLVSPDTHRENSEMICIIPVVSAHQAPRSFPSELRELESSIDFPET